MQNSQQTELIKGAYDELSWDEQEAIDVATESVLRGVKGRNDKVAIGPAVAREIVWALGRYLESHDGARQK